MEDTSKTFYLKNALVSTSVSHMNATKTASIVVALFAALSLTHAAFIDYRSGISERTEVKQMNQMQYLQTRKFGIEWHSFLEDCFRGKTRQRWTESGMCAGVYELLVKMKGGPTRIKLLSLLVGPKNKLQLANELGIDWKAVDRHVSRLLEFNLVQVVAVAGTCTVYSRTEKGRRALSLILGCQKV
jgi:DNA-binding HxlR family transcriptional regulator